MSRIAARSQGAPRTVVFHDLHPMLFSFKPLLAQALGAQAASFDAGIERRPASTESLAEFVAENAEAQVVYARYARPVIGGSAADLLRSVVPVAHPILRMVHRIEHTWSRFPGAQSERLPEGTDLATVISQGLVQPMLRFPYTNFQTALLSGGPQNKNRMHASGLAAAVAERAAFGLVDFPQTLLATVRRELQAIDPTLVVEDDAQTQQESQLVSSLRFWHDALPAATWAKLCRLNSADLVFFDEIAAVVAQDRNLPSPLRREIKAAVKAAGSLTRHRAQAMVKARADAAASTAPTLIEADPVLGWRLRANHQIETTVVGGAVTLQTDRSGLRPVPDQPARGERVLAVYGCSFVFGWGLPVEQTFCALLQARHPEWRIENHGINGYGQGQNLLQLTRDLELDEQRCDMVSFCWVASHLPRNVADLLQVQQQTEQASVEKSALISFMPRACFDENGELRFREVAYSRPELAGLDLAEFSPDAHYLTLVCFAILQRAARLVSQRGGHFFVTVLHDRLPATLSKLLADAGIPVIDAAVAGAEYINPFELSHPNALANRLYADKIQAHLALQTAAVLTTA